MAATPIVEIDSTEEAGFTLTQRVKLWAISWAGYLLIRLIGPTLKYTVSSEEDGPPNEWMEVAVWAFWHRCLIPAAWHWRHRRIGVMTSRSFDGEYIARIIERLGFVAVRGSSSRGAVRALLGMRAHVEKRNSVAFTIDGPRGPRYVVKPGPVLLAKRTHAPLLTFHAGMHDAWVLRSWDAFLIPKPFSSVHLRLGKMIRVAPDADDAAMERAQAELQATLDRVRLYAERAAGSPPAVAVDTPTPAA